MFKNKNKILLIAWLLIVFSVFLVTSNVLAQVDVGVQPLEEIGLPTQDIRITIANIIRIALGFVGIVGVILVLYGGFVWMTSGGNEERVSQARKILTGAAIGLVIVISAYAITSFIISRLAEVTGAPQAGVSSEFPGFPPGFSPGEAFLVRSASPVGAVPIRNVKVRVLFNRSVDQVSVAGNITVAAAADGGLVAGDYNVSGSTVEFTPQAACPEPNQNLRCFAENTEFVVNIISGADGVKSSDGRELVCGLAGSNCRSSFTTGSLIDTRPPTVDLVSPVAGQSLSVDDIILLEALARDDSGIAYVEFYADDVLIDTAAPSLSVSPADYTAQANWDTTGLILGSAHTIQAIAFDIDDHQTESRTISVTVRAAHCFDGLQNQDETNIDCGGADCGSCDGEACVQNSDCASGQCVDGFCLRLPLITRVDPADGAVGNYVSIIGQAFGSAAGEVVFMGDPFNPDDDRTASLALCAAAWRDSQVVVTVPAGAVSGPVRLTTAGNLFDQTNDTRGWQGDFNVNDTVRPGLCSISPTRGEYGAVATIEGNNLGDQTASLRFKETEAESIASWTDVKIDGIAIPNINPEEVPVFATVNNLRSNSLNFTVQTSTTAPRIDYVDPVAGPVGQYLTIFGTNFGGQTGQVFFVSPDGQEILADTSFPENCADKFWHDSYINVKVPNVPIGDYQIKAVKGTQESNLVAFKVNNAPRTPGICRLSPDNGPVGIEMTIYGERFGSDANKVRFFRGQENGSIIAWEDRQIRILVPPLAQTGPVEVIDSSGTLSNSVNFAVGFCSSTTCSETEDCCGDGSCREAGSCQVVPPLCAYSWTFTTGRGGLNDPCQTDADCLAGLACDPLSKTCQEGFPRVVEDQECLETPQSPSPWKSSTDACVNAGIAARFNMNMKDVTLNPANIILAQCNTGARFQADDCDQPVGLNRVEINQVIDIDGNIQEGFVAVPGASLRANTWYQVTLTTGLESETNRSLSQDYLWTFKTRDDTTPCEISHIQVSPQYKTLTYKFEEQGYLAQPTAANCNTLNPDSYAWNWSSTDPSRAAVVNNVTSKTQATALNETESDSPVQVTAAIPTEQKSDFGELTVDFGDPEVILYWPNCRAACVNASIGAKFNVDLQANTLNNNTLRLYACDNENCTNLDQLALNNIVYNPLDLEVEFMTAAALEVNKFYRAVITSGVTSTSNVTLTNLNYSTTGGALDGFSWIFKTKPDGSLCAVDQINVRPGYKELYLIGQSQGYYSQAIGSPDECNPGGQRLNPYSYNWDWDSTRSSVATVSNSDLDPVDGRIDPKQAARSRGEGETDIQAGTQGQVGQGRLKLVCGFTADDQCPAPATIETYGVDDNSCCAPRPKIVRTRPIDQAVSVCRNAVIEADFDQLMELGSILGNVLVEANYGDQPCPAGGQSRSIWGRLVQFFKNIFSRDIQAQAADNWCAVAGRTSLFQENDQTSLQYYLEQPLEPGRQHRVTIQGDPNVSDQNKEGVLSLSGLTMNGDYQWSFTTGDEICDIDYAEVTISPPGEVGVYDLLTCAGRDDCPGDQDSSTPGNQHFYKAVARDDSGVILPANFEWVRTGDQVINLSATTDQQIAVTPSAANGKPLVTVVARGIPPTPGMASKTVNVFVFLCENPWPSLAEFPYRDLTTNFSTFYCRDRGAAGFSDDYPQFSDTPAVTPTDPRIIKEFLFIVE
ncbi:MAG TPA: Ig-like domain-containing protein [Patescibacteria group bacterium]